MVFHATLSCLHRYQLNYPPKLPGFPSHENILPFVNDFLPHALAYIFVWKYFPYVVDWIGLWGSEFTVSGEASGCES